MVYDVRPISTLRELIETSALDHASRTAFVLKKQKQLTEVTYAAFLSDINSRHFLPKDAKNAKAATVRMRSIRSTRLHSEFCYIPPVRPVLPRALC